MHIPILFAIYLTDSYFFSPIWFLHHVILCELKVQSTPHTPSLSPLTGERDVSFRRYGVRYFMSLTISAVQFNNSLLLPRNQTSVPSMSKKYHIAFDLWSLGSFWNRSRRSILKSATFSVLRYLLHSHSFLFEK